MFKIQELAYKILAKITSVIKDDYESFKPRAEEIVSDTTIRLTMLAKGVLSGDIQAGDLKGFAEAELSELKLALLETAIIAESEAQNIVNGFVSEFDAVVSSISTK